MKKIALTLAVLSLFGTPLLAAAVRSSDDQSTYADDYAAAGKLKSALKRGDMRTVADLIEYPFVRERPLSDIKTRKEFVAVSGDYLDAATIKIVIAAKAEEIGWRGVQLANGAIWFNDGKIVAINLRTDAYKRRFAAAKTLEDRTLYPAARGYDEIVFQCHTRSLHIRAQRHGNDLRYFAWEKGAPLTAKPRLMLTSGEQDFQGSGGNYSLKFQKGEYLYQLDVANLCGEDCNNYLDVFKGDKPISHQVCN